MTKLLLYYALRPLADPWAIRLWQHELAFRLGLRGRIVVSPQGLHGTVGGDPRRLEQYATATRQHPALADLRFCRLDGSAGATLPRLSVAVHREIVAFGASEELRIGDSGVLGGGGRQLSPREVHDLVARRGPEVVFLDGRNRYEAEVGRFRGAHVPDVDAARDFLRELDSGKLDEFKHRPVITYCDSGLRSEILMSLMANRGFTEIYQLDGGIVTYGSDYADDGLWEGALYLLGDRVRILFRHHPVVLGRCESCGASTCSYRDCVAPLCGDHALLCNGCADFALCAAHRN